MYETCKKHMMWFCPNNCSFHWVLINVSLGWGKCTGDNSYDQLAQDFLADFLIWVWGCFSKPLWKQWLGRVAIPSSVGLVLSSCHPFLGAQQHVANLYRAKTRNMYCTSKKTTTPMFERKPRSNTSSDCFFSIGIFPMIFPKGLPGVCTKQIAQQKKSVLSWRHSSTCEGEPMQTHGERVGALGHGRNLLPWVIYK